MKRRIVMRTTLRGQYPVTLYQTGRCTFRVTYGLQVRASLNYADAAREYGKCLMHAAMCAGLINED